MDKYYIDSHKLIYHVDRVNSWLKGENVYPIYLEVGLFGGCNHRCIYCAFDYYGYRPIMLDEKYLKTNITYAAENGIKSIMYSGSGEPLLHAKISDIVRFTKKKNIDVAITSNGVMFLEDIAQACLGYLSWFRVSLDAGTAKTYGLIHRTRKEDFNIVLENLENSVKIKHKNKYTCTIGAQFLLLPQNLREIKTAARKLRDIGVDYLIIKPYSQHPLSINRLGRSLDYKKWYCLEEELDSFSNDYFQIIFRKQAMEKLDAQKKPYRNCFGMSFQTFLSVTGDVFPCVRFLGLKEFVFGNIYKQNFKEIWRGRKRKEIMKRIYSDWKIDDCRKACRIDQINEYLWALKNPPEHVNFI